MTDAPYVVLGRLAHHPAQHAATLHFPHGVAAEVCAADEVWPDEVRTRELKIRGARPLRGSSRLARVQQLETGSGHLWIVRRAAAEAIAALAPPGDVRVVPAPLVDADGLLDADWALLDVRAVEPLDRGAAAWAPADPAAPHASLVARVERVAWSAARVPRAPLCRVAEAPELLVARQDVAERVQALLGSWVVVVEPPYDAPSHGGAPCAKLRGIGGLHRAQPGEAPGLPLDEAAGRAAFEALDRLRAGRDEPGDRARACGHPITAYFVARLVDGAPADDTRAGALRHPRYAVLYARDVDRAPRDDTRRAAAAERFSAHAYLEAVERAPHPALVAVLGEASVATMLAERARLRAAARPGEAPFPPEWSVPAAAATTSPPTPRARKPRKVAEAAAEAAPAAPRRAPRRKPPA